MEEWKAIDLSAFDNVALTGRTRRTQLRKRITSNAFYSTLSWGSIRAHSSRPPDRRQTDSHHPDARVLRKQGGHASLTLLLNVGGGVLQTTEA